MSGYDDHKNRYEDVTIRSNEDDKDRYVDVPTIQIRCSRCFCSP